MKELVRRAITGILYVAVIISGICIHPLGFLALFGIITGYMLWEFYGLMGIFEQAKGKLIISCLGGLYLFAAAFLYSNDLIGHEIFFPYLLFILYTLIAEMYDKQAVNPITNWGYIFLGQLYCAGPFALLNFIAAIPDTPGQMLHTPLYVLAIFVFVWMNDTGAYLIGSLFGKHRLFERISPKKSWEGFIGGLVVTALVSQVFYYFVPEFSQATWLLFAVVVVIFATWGDLAESLLKRTLKIKDSGNCFPGHGGMLDRFDSILLATPAAYLFIELFIRN